MSGKGESTPFVTYKYDEDGRRIQKIVFGVVTNYHYQGDSLNVLYETDASGNVVQSYVYGENGQLLAMKKGGATYFYHYNAHGGVIALTDAQGNVVARYEYDTWGKLLSQSGEMATENPYRYAGYQYDQETGLYYLIARYYHPEHGVFLSLDPDPGDTDDILTQNGYTYVNNNPVKFVDPDGEYKIIVDFLVKLGSKAVKFASKAIKKGKKKLPKGSTLKDASNAAFKAARNIHKFKVSNKHLKSAGGNYRKFATDSKSDVNKIIKAALTSKNARFLPNNQPNSYRVITDLGKKIGTKGETKVQVIIGVDGKIWTAYPVK